MNLDGAQNAQVEILKDLFQFQENRAYGDGPRAYVDPESAEFTELQDPTEIGIVTTHAARTPSRAVRSRFKSTMSKPANKIAIGVSASGNSSENHHLLALYHDRNLEHGGLLGQLDDRYGNEIRMMYSGRPRAFPAWHKEAANPLRPGASLGHPKIGAGTLGGFVKDRKSGKLGVLSNNHVLANVNAAQSGDAIYQPGPADGGTPAHTFAILVAYKQIFFGGKPNTTDCAWAKLTDARQHNPAAIVDSVGLTVSAISSTTPVALKPGDHVIKIGRTTGYTQGEVTAILTANLQVNMGGGLFARFDEVVQIEALTHNRFSDVGDSGSVILTPSGKPGGLLFAGTKSGGSLGHGITFANPLDIVLNDLDLDLVI